MSFPPATEMFQFAGFASPTYGFSWRYRLRGGLPHSEIPGSTIARISPGLIAACYVLHRLSVPRHPPDALNYALEHHTQRQRPDCLVGSVASSPMRQTSLLKTHIGHERPPVLPALRRGSRRARRVRLGHTYSLFTQSISKTQQKCHHFSRELGTSYRVATAPFPLTPPPENGGGERDRTDDLLLAKQALSQLSYTPGSKRHFCHLPEGKCPWTRMVGQGGFEPPTSRLSSARSNQLSY
jgi:hypothetical protein